MDIIFKFAAYFIVSLFLLVLIIDNIPNVFISSFIISLFIALIGVKSANNP